MPGEQSHDLDLLGKDKQLDNGSSEFQDRWLGSFALCEVKSWMLTANRRKGCALLRNQWRRSSKTIQSVSGCSGPLAAVERQGSEEARWILENNRLLQTVSREAREALKFVHDLPAIRPSSDDPKPLPRAYAAAKSYLRAVDFVFSEESLSSYTNGLQQVVSLQMGELRAFKPMLQLVLLDQLATVADAVRENASDQSVEEQNASRWQAELVKKAITSLHAIGQVEWSEFFDRHSVTEHVLQADPSGAYARMDCESRQLYLDVIAELSAHSRLSEEQIAEQAVLLALRANGRKGHADSRAAERRSHVGYYLLDHGKRLLKTTIGYKPSLKSRIQEIIVDWPEVYYVVGVELLTLAIVFVLLRHLGIIVPLIPGLLLLIPASQAALSLMNHLTSFLLTPRQLPKLDFSEAVPPECTTLVVVPTLLLNEAQVRRMAESLEVRYLGNRDPNLHFALLTDFPDASQRFDQHDELVGLCSSLIGQLNKKYARDRQGGFFHFHRHRAYNPAQDTWMGWERKRGKLLDLNRLLRNNFDSFPVKVGDLSILPKVQYVITLDSDTRLPKDTAHRLIGALAHPLNRAVIDPETNTVVEGYAILQPRVGTSIESVHQSRLAGIYSGQTGFDIYTHAVSDLYQDLFGEGSFTGKGIYEVDVFQRVLGGRFPCNALLSHDLIEGAHARAGLVSDVEVIDDYPSHFSAYCRRLHRWVRGDWQILAWLFPRVPDYFGRLIHNPLTLLSRWKIFDNLRRSLIEADLFLLLLGGWFFFRGGPVYWMVITLALLLAPTYFQLFFSLLRARGVNNWKGFFKEQANNFLAGHLQVFIMLVFLPHQALVMLDAILRTLTRLTITHRKLLEWETAAEAELGARKKTPVEIYLTLTPWVALAVGAGLAWYRPTALLVALPILGLWLLAKVFTQWVNRPLRAQNNSLNRQDKLFLRQAALRTWRFFRQFSNAANHDLIPDSVQEIPAAIAQRISPTNLGLQLNARLAAYRLGYLTLAELVEETERSMASARQLPRFKGHFFNWYDTKTLSPLPPLFVSTVDSGNLAACLWTLKQGCLSLLQEPLFTEAAGQGLQDHVAMLLKLPEGNSLSTDAAAAVQNLASSVEALGKDSSVWIKLLPRLEQEARQALRAADAAAGRSGSGSPNPSDELAWWASEAVARVVSLRNVVQSLFPWMMPEYERFGIEKSIAAVTLESLPAFVAEIDALLRASSPEEEANRAPAAMQALQYSLQAAVRNATDLSQRLHRLADEADGLLREMDFRFLYNSRKKLFSVGYDISAEKLEKSNYDLLASEARIAAFVAIAKGDAGKEAWFHLGRTQTLCEGERVLTSWSGTMFEYLMPALWMRSYPGTLLDQSVRAAVRCQQKYAKKNGVPWGISEAAFRARDHEGNYQYRAFGAPALALNQSAWNRTVIAPYATFLALPVNAPAAVRNLKRMEDMGWLGRFGFYESADYTSAHDHEKTSYELIRSWMAHHQGMSLLALCNLLCNSSIERWFHQEPCVVAIEILLHERVPLAGLSVEAGLALPANPAPTDRPDREPVPHGALSAHPRGPGEVLRRDPIPDGVSQI